MSLSRFSLYASRRMFSSQREHAYFFYQWARELSFISPQFQIIAAHFDIAGTLVDRFCLAPFFAFILAFKKRGIYLSPTQVTGPMGKSKIEHIRELLAEINEDWYRLFKRYPNDQDVKDVFADFNGYLISNLVNFTELTPYTAETLRFIKQQQIKFTLTSGYSRKAADIAITQLLKSFQPDAMTTSDEVIEGTRIAMVCANNQKLSILPVQMPQTIFFTDAKSDVENVRNSKNCPWIVGITGSSTHMEVATQHEADLMGEEELQQKSQRAGALLLKSGAHCVIPHMGQAPLAILAASQHLLQKRVPAHTDRLMIDCPGLDYGPLPAPTLYRARI